MRPDPPLGIFTTDRHLVVRTWDRWMSERTGIDPAEALNRPLTALITDLKDRGLLTVLEGVLSRGSVDVLAPALHGYLFPSRPSEASATFDRMQQYVTIGPLREDGRIAGLVVTIEDVTARIEQERDMAGELERQLARESQSGHSPARQHIEALTQLLGNDSWQVRRMAVTTLAEHGEAIIDTLVRTLREQHQDFSALSSVLDLLEISDIDVIEPLIRFLEHDDANLRTQAALILGERGDRRAVPGLITRLNEPDANVKFHAIEALGRLGATEAAEPLMAVVEQRDFFLSFPAIQALARLGTPAVAQRLVPLLMDDLLRAPVIDVLGALGDEDVIVPLVGLLNTDEPPVEIITDALAGVFERYEARYGAGEHIADLVRRHVTATGTQQLLDSVARVAPDHLPGLAKVLGWLQGAAVHRALTRLLGHSGARAQVVEALVRNGASVVSLLVDQLSAEDLDTRLAAAMALGRIGDRRATSALVAALGDRELAVAAAGALARIGDRLAFEPLMERLAEPDAAVRQSVIAALHSIGHPEMPGRIAELLGHPDETVRESALRIAGYFGYPECVSLVLACCHDASETVRRTAVEQLPFFDDPRATDSLLERLDDGAPGVRAAAASALARVDHPSRADALQRALHDPDPWVRYLSLRSLGAIGAARALQAVTTCLQHDPAPHVRLAAIDVVGRLTPPEALEILEPLTVSDNDDIARAATNALGHVGRPDALAALERLVRAPAAPKRLAAVEALSVRREPAVPHILQWVAAADEDAGVAGRAIEALAAFALREDEGRDAIRMLAALTAEPARRAAAIAALGALPARRVGDVAAGLRHPSIDVRSATIEALARMRQPEASRAIESALEDAAPAVRLTAMAELKHLGTRRAGRKLMALARTDPDARVRQAAIMVIARTDRPGLDAAESR